jgi:ubiquinone/menaquinone biosynthesis C-methylase UbiE
MKQSDGQFTGSIPALYDRYLGPLIFASYADDLADRVAATTPRLVLETAAGTGIVTRAMRKALPAADISATDLNQPMLDHAAAQPGVERVVWRQADAQSLPFLDAAFDAVVCQFGVMFFPDKTAAYRETRRVLRPGGRFLFSVWDSLAENEVPATVSAAVAALFPADPPQFLARTPYTYNDVTLIERELRTAGFANVAVEPLAMRSRAPSARDPALGFCHGSPLRSEIEARDSSRLAEATDAAEAAVAARFGTGPIDGKIRAYVFTASG